MKSSATKNLVRLAFAAAAAVLMGLPSSSALGGATWDGASGENAGGYCNNSGWETPGPQPDGSYFFPGEGCSAAYYVADAATLITGQAVISYKTTGFVGQICGSFELSGLYIGSSGNNCFSNDVGIVATFPFSINPSYPLIYTGYGVIVTWHPDSDQANAYLRTISVVGVV